MALGKKDSSSEATNGSSSTFSGGDKVAAFLGPGSKVVGKLTFTGPVELDGYIEGEIQSEKSLTIGEAAVVNAKVVGTEVVVRGTVNGDITASRKLSLKAPAKVVGNINSKNLSIEEGVTFEGKCSMNGSVGASSSDSSSSKVGAV